MGTNYYARVNCCDLCGRYDEMHIGKSSYGWRFVVDASHGRNYIFEEFCEWLDFEVNKIIDEYGNRISKKELMEKIESKSKDKSHPDAYKSGPIDILDREFF